MTNKIGILNHSHLKIPLRKKLHGLLSRLLEILEISDKELELIFLDDEQIRSYYLQYFGEDRPTDVIAFPLESEAATGPVDSASLRQGPGLKARSAKGMPRATRRAPGELPILGCLVISIETARRQAREHRQSVWDEIRLLIVHGVLHLIGYNHAEAEEGKIMRAKEKKLLERTASI